jgi:hypothetical protein
MEDFHLVDAGTAANRLEHTWYRKSRQGQSSRIDLTMTNIPMTNLQYKTTMTIFDHVYLTVQFGQIREKTVPTMKDFILGTGEYIIRVQEKMEAIIQSKGQPLRRELRAESPDPQDRQKEHLQMKTALLTLQPQDKLPSMSLTK